MRLAFRAALAIQRESPLGGCAAGMANLGGGGHPGCAGVATRSNSISTQSRGDAEEDAERMRDIECALFPGFERGGSGDTLCLRGICVVIDDSSGSLLPTSAFVARTAR